LRRLFGLVEKRGRQRIKKTRRRRQQLYLRTFPAQPPGVVSPGARQLAFKLRRFVAIDTAAVAAAIFASRPLPSILAAVHNQYVLKKPPIGLQDTNDTFLANMQKDGTYSIVPRIWPAAKITPDKLIASASSPKI